MSLSPAMMEKYTSNRWRNHASFDDDTRVLLGVSGLQMFKRNGREQEEIHTQELDDTADIKYQWKGKFLYTRGRGGVDVEDPDSL